MGLKIAVLVKQVPRFEELRLRPDGRIDRTGIELELNPYCRRAVATGVTLAKTHGGTCSVITLGPPTAEDCLREAVAWGCDDGILISDPCFAGSDSLATSKALAAAITELGPFDLILTGRNSVDADTGQVGPQLAELLGLPFLSGVREFELDGDRVRAECELDDGWLKAEAELPLVMSCAERLCDPAKVSPEGRALVADGMVRTLLAADLGHGPWGAEASRTEVGEVHAIAVNRRRTIFDGAVQSEVQAALTLLVELTGTATIPGQMTAQDETNGVAADWERKGSSIVVLAEPGRPRATRELLGAAARLASDIGAHVQVVVSNDVDPADQLAGWGADEVVVFSDAIIEEDIARSVADWCVMHAPWGLLASSTSWGREVASRIAARLDAGLTGDAVDLNVVDGRLVAWKPAFGGSVVAAITATSTIQMATVRPGVLPLLAARDSAPARVVHLRGTRVSRLRRSEPMRDDDLVDLAIAEAVVGVGAGILPNDYPLVEPLLEVLGAELAATRKVTDKHWLPRARQVGVTGRSISPALYVALGLSGKFNHMMGVRSAGLILAINSDRKAPVFQDADIGIVGDWRDVVPHLVAALHNQGIRGQNNPE